MSIWYDRARKRYIAKFVYKGKTYKNEKSRTRAAAESWEVDKRRLLENPAPPPEPAKPEPVSFQFLAIKYIEDCEARMQSNTVNMKSNYLAQFLRELGSNTFQAEAVSKVQIIEHLMAVQEKSGNKLANRHLKELKALYNWGIRNDYVAGNPALTIEPYSEEPFIKYVPPAKDIDAVILAAPPEEGDMLLILYHTAARISEIRKLTWEDINFEHRWVRLWTRKRKRGQLEPNLLPMTDKLYAVLRERWAKRDTQTTYVFHKHGEMLSRNSGFIRNMMERLCTRAAVKRFGFHAIRHHVASILQDSGKATLKEIQLFLRHKRQTTTENYLHQIDPALTRVVGVLENRTDFVPIEGDKEAKSGD
ncbi:MAG: tyrosine-type recombinase/integrase [Syntrophobacteraceae bacterium]